MKYSFIHEEAKAIADAVSRDYGRQGFRIHIEKQYNSDAPYRTTLLARRGTLVTLLEAQHVPAYHKGLQALARWLKAERVNSELYITTHEDCSMKGEFLKQLSRDGVGLIFVDNSRGVSVYKEAVNPALVVTPDPTLKYGAKKAEINEAVCKFNSGDRKQGLQAMCEIIEGLTDQVGRTAISKRILRMPEDNFTKADWSSQINLLSSSQKCPKGLVVKEPFKADLHSFRGARNLLNHKVRTRREEARRQQQYAERMMMGPRLAAELLAIKRKLQRPRKKK